MVMAGGSPIQSAVEQMYAVTADLSTDESRVGADVSLRINLVVLGPASSAGHRTVQGRDGCGCVFVDAGETSLLAMGVAGGWARARVVIAVWAPRRARGIGKGEEGATEGEGGGGGGCVRSG